jgi:hypothetical protein
MSDLWKLEKIVKREKIYHGVNGLFFIYYEERRSLGIPLE